MPLDLPVDDFHQRLTDLYLHAWLKAVILVKTLQSWAVSEKPIFLQIFLYNHMIEQIKQNALNAQCDANGSAS